MLIPSSLMLWGIILVMAVSFHAWQDKYISVKMKKQSITQCEQTLNWLRLSHSPNWLSRTLPPSLVRPIMPWAWAITNNRNKDWDFQSKCSMETWIRQQRRARTSDKRNGSILELLWLCAQALLAFSAAFPLETTVTKAELYLYSWDGNLAWVGRRHSWHSCYVKVCSLLC